jgi:hypothetical protein
VVLVALCWHACSGLRVAVLIKALLELPLFHAGPLLVVVALTLRKRLATPLRTARQKATLKIEHKRKKEGDRWTHFVGSMPSFIIFVGAAAVILETVRVSPKAATELQTHIIRSKNSQIQKSDEEKES